VVKELVKIEVSQSKIEKIEVRNGQYEKQTNTFHFNLNKNIILQFLKPFNSVRQCIFREPQFLFTCIFEESKIWM